MNIIDRFRNHVYSLTRERYVEIFEKFGLTQIIIIVSGLILAEIRGELNIFFELLLVGCIGILLVFYICPEWLVKKMFGDIK